jgi:LPS sulfotransferase NodH
MVGNTSSESSAGNTAKRGIMVIGTQRSGSNLFRLMLNQLPEVVALHPPHILQTFMPLLPSYGALTDQHGSPTPAFSELIDDVCTFVERNPASWDNISLDRQEVASRCSKPSLIEIYRVIQERAAEVHQKPVWCCKSMANVSYIPEIEAAGLAPIYIHLYRDGRDVALSFRKAVVGEKHWYHIAQQWVKDQREALDFTAQYARDRTIQVRYENLVADPERVMRDICEKVGVAFTPEVLQYHRSEEAQSIAQAGSMWANVVKPVMSQNSNKFLSEMRDDEVALYEAVAGETLKELGYELCAKSPRTSPFTKEEIAAFDAENKRLKQEARAKLTAEELEKRRGQEELVAQVRERLYRGAGSAAA